MYLVFLMLIVTLTSAYNIPDVEFKLLDPIGFEASIPADHGVVQFSFHAKLNERITGSQYGMWSEDIFEPLNGRFVFRNNETRLTAGDTINYWVFVHHNGRGYRKDNGIFIVKPMPSSSYKIPKVEFKIVYPKGFVVSIPAEDGVSLFEFHGNLNKEIKSQESGMWSMKILKPTNSRFIFRDDVTSLTDGDKIYYWTYVIHNGLAYSENNGLYHVKLNTLQNGSGETTINTPTIPLSVLSVGAQLVIDSRKRCQPSITTVNDIPSPCSGSAVNLPRTAPSKKPKSSLGSLTESFDECTPSIATITNGERVPCAGQIIFEENFDNHALDPTKWVHERRFASQPDYEFAVYLLNDEVLKVESGLATLRPTPLQRIYGVGILTNTLDLGSNCTGILSTEDCIRPGNSNDIIPPLISSQFSTKTHFSFMYGKLEIRAKMPNALWVFPQMFLEPVEHRYGFKNYQSGQMRVAFSRSSVGDLVNELFGGILLNALTPFRNIKMCRKTGVPVDWSADFHTFTLKWLPNVIIIGVDEEEYCTIKPANGFANVEVIGKPLENRDFLKSGSKLAPFDQEFYIKLGYGIGGHYDFPDNQTTLGKKKPWRNFQNKSMQDFWIKQMQNWTHWLDSSSAFQIDYVKVYSV